MVGAGSGAVGGFDHDMRKILCIDKVAPRLGDKTAFSLRQPFKKNRQRPADVAWPDHVGETKRNPIHPA